MDPVALLTPSLETLQTSFVCCSYAAGYCRDTGRQDIADQIQDDLPKIVKAISYLEDTKNRTISELSKNHGNAWVRYFAAVFVSQINEEDALLVFLDLSNYPDGLVSVAAQVAVASIQK